MATSNLPLPTLIPVGDGISELAQTRGVDGELLRQDDGPERLAPVDPQEQRDRSELRGQPVIVGGRPL